MTSYVSPQETNLDPYLNKGYTPEVPAVTRMPGRVYSKDQQYEILESGFSSNYDTQGFTAAGPNQLEKELRHGFIRKVYGILTLQLTLTAGVAAVCVLSDTVKVCILNNLWTTWVGFFLSFGLLCGLMCYRHKYPLNVYLLGTWTFVMAYTIGVVCAAYASQDMGATVVQAAGLTMAVFFGLTLFTFQTKIDFSFLGGALFAGLWILMIWGFIVTLFGFQQTYLYSLFGAIIFSLYILFDTSQLMHHLGYDEYIVASISLYLDILNLFLFILRLLTRRNN